MGLWLHASTVYNCQGSANQEKSVSANRPPLEPPDVTHFDANRSRVPAETLASYAGRHVAWSPDGTRILASGASPAEVDEQLASLGVHFSQVVHDYIDPLDEAFLG
jgi:hypothetical protein